MLKDFSALLACPACGSDLTPAAQGFSCSCGAFYRTAGEAVHFLEAKSGHPTQMVPDSFTVKIKNRFKRNASLYNLVLTLFGTSNAGMSEKRFVELYLGIGDLALNLGAGTRRKLPRTIHVDMFAFPGIDVIADIERLPFKSGTFGAVFCQSVMEHVKNPQKVMLEMRRVIKPGGKCYMGVPFVYPFHSSPHDYYRWTLEGIRQAAKECGFEEVASGLRNGPSSAMFIVLANWLGVALSFGSSTVFEVVSLAATVVTAPLAHVLDFFLAKLKVAENVASGFYYIGEVH